MLYMVMSSFSWCTVTAEILFTTGKTEGIYHQDRWGVGRFNYFIVHPSLHAKLHPYEGKNIRLKIIKQEGMHKVAILSDVDEIEELPQPPFEIRITTRPDRVRAGQPFQVVVETINKSKDSALYLPHQSFRLRRPNDEPKTGQPWVFLKDYISDQLAISDERMKSGGHSGGNFGLKMAEVRSSGLAPGSSRVMAAMSPGIPQADGEVALETQYAFAAPDAAFGTWASQGHHQAWLNLEVDKAVTGDSVEKLLESSDLETRLDHDGWSKLEFRLKSAKEDQLRVPGVLIKSDGTPDPGHWFQVAALQGFSADRLPVELEAIRLPEQSANGDLAQLLHLPAEGAMLSGTFRKESRYAPAITGISVEVLTEHGYETVVLTDDFKDPDIAPETPFGPETEGVKIRIRPSELVFREDEPLDFHFQIENVSGKPICWWKPANNIGENILIDIDGEPIETPFQKAGYIGGWAAEWTCRIPEEGTVRLPADLKLAKGKHTLRYRISSDGGTYTNSSNTPIPLFSGELLSNETEFIVE